VHIYLHKGHTISYKLYRTLSNTFACCSNESQSVRLLTLTQTTQPDQKLNAASVCAVCSKPFRQSTLWTFNTEQL